MKRIDGGGREAFIGLDDWVVCFLRDDFIDIFLFDMLVLSVCGWSTYSWYDNHYTI